MRVLIPCALVGIGCLFAVAAPAAKTKAENLGPITDEQLATSADNLGQIGLAMHNYHDANNQFPAYLPTKVGKPGLSWRVAILPYVGQDDLYKKFKLDEPWDSEHNAKLIDKVPDLFAPARGKADKGQTYYQMFAGKQGLVDPDGGAVRMADVTDGLSNTFMVVEGAKPVPWTKPDDLPYDGKQVPKLGGMFDGQFHAVLGDGSVYRFKGEVAAETLHRLIDRADGQPVALDGERVERRKK